MSLAHIPAFSRTGGTHINLLQPDTAAGHISIETIANSLAQINLHTGHTLRPLSVAEHTLLMVEILEHQGINKPEVLVAALMSEMHACVVGVASTPMKALLGPAWAAANDRWANAMRTAFGLAPAYAEYGHLVWMASQFAAAAELHDLLPTADGTGAANAFVPPEWLNLRHRDHMTWADWRQAWLDKWEELQFALQGGL
jgi:uncharacterized protein